MPLLKPKINYSIISLIVLLLALIIATIILASVPPVSRDALTQHLFVPKLYLQHGGIYQIPWIPFSYYPMNLDLLYMIPLALGCDFAAKYIHYLFALLTAWLLYRYLNKRVGNNFALIGVIFFLSIPIIVKLSITAYVDLGLVFFTTASLLLLIHWVEKGFQVKYLFLSGLCCGLAAGTKYNGLLSIFILTLLVPLIYQRCVAKEKQSNAKSLVYALLFAAATVMSFSPWLIRDYIWTGNPIYPLHNGLFQKIDQMARNHKTNNSPTIQEDLRKRHHFTGNVFVNRKILYHETWWQTLLLPIRFFFQGRDDNPQFFDGKLTPFLLLLPILAFYFPNRKEKELHEKRFLLLFSLLFFFIAFFQASMRIRYIVPIVPPLVILSIYGLEGFYKAVSFKIKSKRHHYRPNLASGFFLLLFLMLGYNAQYIFSQFSLVNPLVYLGGNISRDEYISKFRPEYPAILYANTHLPTNAKVLCIFLGNKGYYMNFRPVFEPRTGIEVLSKYLDRDICGKEIIKGLKNDDINYALLRDNLTTWWFRQLKNKQKSCVSTLLKNAETPLFSKDGYTLFKIDE